ncbi:MAG: AEC family transporter [Candidatus Omnitrophica bacterium]|nr:AEC family transporter [Candidatus Omnitrophota bacterium]
MFIQSFKITVLAVSQIFLMAAVGYFLVRRNLLGEDGLRSLTRMVIEVVFPCLIIAQLLKNFSFSLYPKWWVFPLVSVVITIVGLAVGWLFLWLDKEVKSRVQFLSLVAFQNSGYLPLALVASMLPKTTAETMFIYIFLFLLGFDLIIWSWGVYLLAHEGGKKFELFSLFSPPVIASLTSLLLIFFGWHKFIPAFILNPVEMIGNCTLPLAMFIVGGNLASICLGHIDRKEMLIICLAKLVIMPLVGLFAVFYFGISGPLGLLIVMQLAMPPATSLSIIIKHYRKEDWLISQGVFFGHILSIFTIPIFLSLYFTLDMVK